VNTVAPHTGYYLLPVRNARFPAGIAAEILESQGQPILDKRRQPHL